MTRKSLILATSLALGAASVGVVHSNTQEASLRAAAAAGDGQARRELALHLAQLDQQAEALELLEAALADGDRRAGPLLAQHLAQFGQPQDLDRAAELASRHRDHAEPAQAKQLGLRLATRALDPDLPQETRAALAGSALTLLRESYNQRDVDALWHVGYLGAVGLPRPSAIDGPLVAIEQAADRGHGAAAAWLARYYLDGELAPVDAERGVRALTTAAKAGHALAMLELSSRHRQGRGVPRDADLADFWADRALEHRGKLEPMTAEIPLPRSLRQLAAGPVVHVASRDTTAALTAPTPPPAFSAELNQARATIRELTAERDHLRARLSDLQARYDALLAEHQQSQVDAKALNERGLQAYRAGDFEASLPLFRQAAETGFAPAQTNLAIHYLNGQVVPQDLRQAVALLGRASEQGHLPATLNLATLYEHGVGVHQDRSRAITYYQRAALQGSPTAHEAITRLKSAR
jgi:TPR repeat protein